VSGTPADVATDCDGCHGDVAFGETAYLVPTGEEMDGTPVARLLCADCYWGPDA
jgi:hypothetical protein